MLLSSKHFNFLSCCYYLSIVALTTAADKNTYQQQQDNSTASSASSSFLDYGITLSTGEKLPPPHLLDYSLASAILEASTTGSSTDTLTTQTGEELPFEYLTAAADIQMNAILTALSPEYSGPYRMVLPTPIQSRINNKQTHHQPMYYQIARDAFNGKAMKAATEATKTATDIKQQQYRYQRQGWESLRKFPALRLPALPVPAQVEYSRPPVGI
eukprot:GHVS01069362.1.p1 GENE.GHVS01069362.1~~GHVS01069362.1.p1  ORF type:complete len:214 (-),score=45.73 GHVS01069362.1:449-1090(-)